MKDLFSGIREVSDSLAQNHNLDVSIFLFVYVISFIPFYLGYFLLIYGSTRNLEWNDIFEFKLKNKLQWNNQTRLGLYLHLFGRVMPYAYILIYGRQLPTIVYIIIISFIILAVIFFVKKFFYANKNIKIIDDIEIYRIDKIISISDKNKLWEIYNTTFEKVNKISPCKQSFDHDEFQDVMEEETVRKYLICKNKGEKIGIALVTDNFKNTPWISSDYFKFNYPKEYNENRFFYFLGLAIDEEYRGNKYSIRLIEHIFDDIPQEAIVGFDHSRNINPMLHHFTKIIKQSSKVKRKHIDRQNYHVITRK